jgi:hypothetical protein
MHTEPLRGGCGLRVAGWTGDTASRRKRVAGDGFVYASEAPKGRSDVSPG